jgi:hypothetical protein
MQFHMSVWLCFCEVAGDLMAYDVAAKRSANDLMSKVGILFLVRPVFAFLLECQVSSNTSGWD